RVHAAIIELDALADAIRAAAQDHDLRAIAGIGLAFFLVGRIQVRGGGRELGCARVDPLEYRPETRLDATLPDRRLLHTHQCGDARVGNALALQAPQARVIEAAHAGHRELPLLFDEIADLRKEPGVDAGELRNFGQRHSLAESLADVPQALRAGVQELLVQRVRVQSRLRRR